MNELERNDMINNSDIFLYRFRSVSTLLQEHQELEKQEIYFASPEQLNDPIEGYYDIFWEGDIILWKNFLKHYLLCLEQTITFSTLGGECFKDNFIPNSFQNIDELPTDDYKLFIKRIYELFFSRKEITIFLEYISRLRYKIKQNEIILYLRQIHSLALDAIFRSRSEFKLGPEYVSIIDNQKSEAFFENLLNIKNSSVLSDSESKKDMLFSIINRKHKHYQTFMLYKKDSYDEYDNRFYICVTFPDEYIKSSLSLIYPEWYTACFMDKCDNPSVWGHYGNGHRGICLKFKVNSSEKNELHIQLKGGKEHPDRDDVDKYTNFKFYKINYQKKFFPINFFSRFARLPIPNIAQNWFSDEKRGFSPLFKEFYSEMDSWREEYWKSFYDIITTKLEDWAYECEYRLVIDNFFGGFEKPTSRKYTYKFDDLDGVIFGIKTSIPDQLKVIEVMEKKCREQNRKKPLHFYHAYYDERLGKILYS